MAAITEMSKRRPRRVEESELARSGFTCAPVKTGSTVCRRVLWEDDRFGRVSELIELPAQQARVFVEVPAGRTASGQVLWKPLEHRPDAKSETVRLLLAIIKELAGDVFTRTTPLRSLEPFEVDESVQYGGVV